LIEDFIDILQMGSPAMILLVGLVIGIQHAFEPDHLAAISTQIIKKGGKHSQSITSNLRKTTLKSSLMGAFWGAGHTSSILVVGLLVAGLSLTIPNNVFMGLEFVVGLMLVFLGILLILNKGFLKQKHLHPHEHADGTIHTHAHTHDGSHNHGHKSYIIGCIHGLAGSGAIVALIASGLDSFELVFSFLILFGFGSIIGMTVASGIMGIPFALSSKIQPLNKILRYVIAAFTIIIGTNIIYEITFTGSYIFN